MGESTTRDTSELNQEQCEILAMLQTKLEDSEKLHPVNLRSVDRKKVREKTAIVNSVINRIRNEDILEMNTLILAGANVVAELIGSKKGTKKKGEY